MADYGSTKEKLILHHCPETRSMRSLWLAYELGLDIKVVTYGFGDELRSPEYLGVHPLGRVPSIQIGESILFESGAITEVLCEQYDNDQLFRAPSTPERPEWLQWLHYAETMTVHAANLTQQFIALNKPELRSPVIIKLEKRRLEKALEVIETSLNGRHYMLASGFSAADISIGYSLHVARLFTDLAEYKRTNDYYTRLSLRPSFQKSLPTPNDPHRFYRESFYTLDDT